MQKEGKMSDRPKHNFKLPKCGDAQRLVETLGYEVNYLWEKVNQLEDKIDELTKAKPVETKPSFNRAAL
jgi:transcription initiation factor IIE alpha subunit